MAQDEHPTQTTLFDAEPEAPAFIVEPGEDDLSTIPKLATPYTWSEQHRHECEVRHVLTLDPLDREDYLQKVAEKRGAAAGEKLRRDVGVAR